MNAHKALLSCLLLAAALPAFATPVLVDFDAQASANPSAVIDASTLSYVDGISIGGSSAAYLVASTPAFPGVGLGNFYGSTASSSDHTSNKGALFLAADSFTVSVAGGFNGEFSVDFAGLGSANLIALDASGNVIQTFGSQIANDSGCDRGYSCNWQTLSFDLGSTTEVYAVEIVGQQTGSQFFDNLSFADIGPLATQPGNVPEPGGVALSLAALGALAWTTRKRIAKRN